MIKVYRKDKSPKVRMTKAQSARFQQHLDLMARTQRPALVEFMISGGFSSLPELAPSVVKNRGLRIMDHSADGWVIPASDYKVDASEQSSANSITLWIEKNLVPFGIVAPNAYAVVVE